MPFDAALAQRLSDRAVNILRATEAHELLPRVATSPDHFECQRCAKQVVEKPVRSGTLMRAAGGEMRGSDERSGALFSYVDLEARVPAAHPLRTIGPSLSPIIPSLGRCGRHTAYEGYERFDPRIHVGNYRRDAIAAMAERCVDNVLAVMAGRDPGADSVLNPMVIGHK